MELILFPYTFEARIEFGEPRPKTNGQQQPQHRQKTAKDGLKTVANAIQLIAIQRFGIDQQHGPQTKGQSMGHHQHKPAAFIGCCPALSCAAGATPHQLPDPAANRRQSDRVPFVAPESSASGPTNGAKVSIVSAGGLPPEPLPPAANPVAQGP